MDLRVTRLEQEKEWQKVRQRYLDEDILPMLAEAKETLQELGVTVPMEVRLADGKVDEEIVRLAGGQLALQFGGGAPS